MANAGGPAEATGTARPQARGGTNDKKGEAMSTTQDKHPGRSRWAVSVAQTVGRPGETQELDAVFPAPSGVGDDFYGLPEDSDVHVVGALDSLVDGLMFQGTASARIIGRCARCLKDVSHDAMIDLSAFMPVAVSRAAENDRLGRGSKANETLVDEMDEAEDVYPLTGGGEFADFEALLRDAFIQALPFTPLCSPDCKGLCPQCGIDLNKNPDHRHEAHDTRWDALESLRERLERQAGATGE